MLNLYTKPLRVYILLGALALWGILSGFNLPISLFPMSSQPRISVYIPFGNFSAQQFFETYGKDLESSLQGIKVEKFGVQELTAEYRLSGVQYFVQFEWGAPPEQSLKDVETKVYSKMSGVEEGVRRGISVYHYRNNQGFFALSFYSPMRSLDEIYDLLNPLVTPISSRITDADGVGLWNPNSKEMTITLLPEKLAQYEISTYEVQSAIQQAIFSYSGGTFKLGERDYQLDIPKNAENPESIGQIRIARSKSSAIFLKDISKISIGLSQESRQKFKTSGVDSLILFANPKEGGNIKNMSDQIMAEISKIQPQLPKDISYKVLVNPSDFINESIEGVVREVFLAAFLAVLVLFCFIGSFKNVVTAAIEIPLSLLLAFILMRLTGMNLNLISLGGLALSAGMNVDASVVVLENIFRHFEGKKSTMTYLEKAQLVIQAVNEVKLPIIASTIASLVVFAPLVFTSGLTNSLLGDLAKAVIFSHGLSAVVALILVPTIRLQLLSRSQFKEVHSPFERYLKRIEEFYESKLKWFLLSNKAQGVAFFSVLLLLITLIALVLPKLNKEIIGRPDSDYLVAGVYSSTFTSSRQLEAEIESMEQLMMEKFGDKFLYTFTQLNGDQNGNTLYRLKNKKDIELLSKQAEDLFKNTATKFYFVEQWNPSELKIPNPPEVRVEVTGGNPEQRLAISQDLQTRVLGDGIYDKFRVTPGTQKPKRVSIRDFTQFGSQQNVLSKPEISHYLRTATDGIYVQKMTLNQQELPIYMRLPKDSVTTLEQIQALPVGFESRLIPLGALAQFSIEERLPNIYRENQSNMFILNGTLNKINESEKSKRKERFEKVFEEFKTKASKEGQVNILNAVPDKELQEALNQLKWAILISIALIFITMVLQLGDLVQSALVLVAIPLGFLGVLLSLWIFKSTLSLNSGLGTILLNGIAVANSIILVDFIQKVFNQSRSALQATLTASRARLRPILMTSMTTVLGMLPIALGMGEGGKILQPLGIAVCGGLWVSMSLTLFFVPALQYRYLKTKEQKKISTLQHSPHLTPEVTQ